MSQQIINISTPDDGLGDVLRNGFDKTNQNFTELYNGKVDKVTGKGLSENDFTDADKAKLDGIEAGAEVNVQADWGETDPTADSFILNKPPSLYSAFGYFHYADLDTQTTPLSLSPSDPLQLINDTLGAFTNEDQAPYGISGVWDKPADSLDFSQLSIGDAVLFRADLSISTTSVNQNLQLYIKFGIGTPSEYDLLIDSWNEKSVVTFKHFLKDISFSIDNEDWRTAPAKIYILSDHNGSVKVNGWYIPIIRKSVNLIDFYSDPLKQDKLTETNFGEFIDGLDSKTDIKDEDEFIISDSEDSLKSKKTRFLYLKTKLKSYLDTFYLSLSIFDNFVTDVFDSLDNKLDKSTTASSVYATNTAGGQTMIPFSDFGTVKGTGTANRISKFTASETIGDSQIFDNGTNVGIGAESTSARLDIRAQGSTSSDIVLRVRNSVNTNNLLQITGVGNILLANNTFIGFRNSANNADAPVIQLTNTNQLNLGTNSSSAPATIGLWTNSTERIRILNNGNVNIGSFTNIESALLVLNSTSKGFLPPRMTTVEKNAITSPAAGLIVYDTTDNKHYGFNGTTWNALY